MSKFNPNEVGVKSDPSSTQEFRIVKLDGDQTIQVQPFEFARIQKPGDGDYGAVKERFGALAATDQAGKARPQKDSRFSVNPLMRDALSIEEEERRKIEERVEARIEELRAQAEEAGRQAGYEEGLARGKTEAFQQFKAEGDEKLQRLEAFVSAMEATRGEIFKANERFVLETIHRVIKSIVLKELEQDPEYPLRLARGLIERTGVRENIRIKLNPHDLQSAALIREGLEQSFGPLKNLTIETSPQVLQGGCYLETQWSFIDASVETQIQQALESLVGKPGSPA